MIAKSQPDVIRTISRINWNQVYYFSLVATYGSIKAAAEALDLSSSTLSEHISDLEKDLEVPLFYRHGPRLSVTEQGQRLFAHSKAMFENGQRLLDVVSPLKLGCYPVSVACVPGLHLQLAYGWIGDYLQKFGTINMKVRHCEPAEFEVGLSRAIWDFGFSDRRPERTDLKSEKIDSGKIRFYVSHELEDSRLSDLLKKLPLLVCRSDNATDSLIERPLREAGLPPVSVITSDFPSVLVDLCKRGLGVGVFTEGPNSVEPDLSSLRSPKDAPKITLDLYAVWSASAENTEAVSHLKTLLDG